MINVDKVINFKNSEIKNKNQQFPIMPPELPALPFNLILVGSSGAGKTTTLCNLLAAYQQQNAFDRIALFSPTGVPDEDTGLTADPRLSDPNLGITDMFEKYSDDDLENIINEQKELIVEYKEYLDDMKLWREYCKNPDDDKLEEKAFDMMERRGELPPTCDIDRYPSSLVILDDMGDDLSIKKSGKSKLNNFVCRIRHALFSFASCYQALAQCPATIRKQCNLWIIYKTQDVKYLNKIWSECCAGDMNFDKFLKLFNMLEHRHEFIMIDMKAGNIKRKYRMNFDKFLDIGK